MTSPCDTNFFIMQGPLDSEQPIGSSVHLDGKKIEVVDTKQTEQNNESIFSRIFRLLNTSFMYIKSSTINLFLLKNSEQFYRLNNYGRRLIKKDIEEFLQQLEKKAKFNKIEEFFKHYINVLTFEAIKKILDSKFKEFGDKTLTLVIPITFKTQSYIERDHIAAILIHKGQIEYFDSKGITSKYQKLNQNGTLHDVLLYLKTVFQIKKPIKENTEQIQWDINNCVPYVCFFYYIRLILNEKIKPDASIDKVRDTVNEIILSKKEEDTAKEEKPLKSEAVIFEDFEFQNISQEGE